MVNDFKNDSQKEFVFELKEKLTKCLELPDKNIVSHVKEFVNWWLSLDLNEENKPT